MQRIDEIAARFGVTAISVHAFTGVTIRQMEALMEDYPPQVLEFFLAGCAFNMTGGTTPCHADVQQDSKLLQRQHEKPNEQQPRQSDTQPSSLDSLTQTLTQQTQSITELANSIAMLAQGIMEMAEEQQDEGNSDFYMDGTPRNTTL